MDRFEEGLKRLCALHNLKAPNVIKAHYLFRVVVPRLVAELGVEVCAQQFGALFADAFCRYSGICLVCRKIPADGDDGLCPKCRAESDRWCAEMDERARECGYDETTGTSGDES